MPEEPEDRMDIKQELDFNPDANIAINDKEVAELLKACTFGEEKDFISHVTIPWL